MESSLRICSRRSSWRCSCVPFAGQRSGRSRTEGCTGASSPHILCGWRSPHGADRWSLKHANEQRTLFEEAVTGTVWNFNQSSETRLHSGALDSSTTQQIWIRGPKVLCCKTATICEFLREQLDVAWWRTGVYISERQEWRALCTHLAAAGFFQVEAHQHISCRAGCNLCVSQLSTWQCSSQTVLRCSSAVLCSRSYRWCKQPCSPGGFSEISEPCLRATCCPATGRASPSAAPAAASWSSGSSCGRGCCCKVPKEHTSIQHEDTSTLAFKYRYAESWKIWATVSSCYNSVKNTFVCNVLPVAETSAKTADWI